MIKKLVASGLGAVALAVSAPASAVPVGLELVLLVDVSGSVDDNEYALQKQGYVQAFQSQAVKDAILASQLGAIAVTYVEWSGVSQQSVRVGWTMIDSEADAEAFATAINGVSRAFSGLTAIQTAMSWGAGLFGTETGGTSNGYESLRQVMDVSGDGSRNDGLTGTAGRDAAIAAGVDTINGLAILGSEAGLENYYRDFVKAGGGFVIVANDFGDFSRAIQDKLVKEISQVPEPGTLALLGLGLFGLAAFRRRGAA